MTVVASGEEMSDDPPESFKSEVRKRFGFFSLCHEKRKEQRRWTDKKQSADTACVMPY